MLAGWIANLFIFFWLWKTFHAAGIHPVTTAGVWFSLAAVLSLYFGAFTAVAYLCRRSPYRPWMLAATWVALEHVRSVVLTGFPWATLAQTQVSNILILQTAAFAGSEGISFLIVAVNAAFADLLRASWPHFFSGINELAATRADRMRWSLGTVFLSAAIAFGVGWSRLSGIDRWAGSSLRVAVLQGNIDQYMKWDKQHELNIRTAYERLLNEIKGGKPSLIVWPESSVPGWIPNEPFYLAWIQRLASGSGAHHIVGAVTTRAGDDFNAAFHFEPDGRLANEYDKQHLVPFGEYIPFGTFFRRWIPYLGQLGVFQSGTKPVLFSIEDVPVFPTICYESIFPDLVAQGVNQGARLIVNITNDGWFLDSAAPKQHLDANILRAVENGRPLIRAANTGISAVIDAQGRVTAKSGLLQSATIVQDVSVPEARIQTWRSRFGPWFRWLCWIVLLGGGALAWLRRDRAS